MTSTGNPVPRPIPQPPLLGVGVTVTVWVLSTDGPHHLSFEAMDGPLSVLWALDRTFGLGLNNFHWNNFHWTSESLAWVVVVVDALTG